ncbi:Transglutaminase-like enzyme, putative cysteine protease [Flavobacteriaceae bacterium MAR_2010_188]|nr:Transglutaminase-like enzyme, putative cysteine protease [Flavobacteriaceae bacterium MAR_2010_188]
MAVEYFIRYKSENQYENPVSEAIWQFLVTPTTNENQTLINSHFTVSQDAKVDRSINSFRFEIARVSCSKPFTNIQFEAEFKVLKENVNPFENDTDENHEEEYSTIEGLDFKVDHIVFLTSTSLSTLPSAHQTLYNFDRTKSIFNNIQNLNLFINDYLEFEPGVTSVDTTVDKILEKRKGVCQDYTHLFLAIARYNGIPARYVSGYLHQGSGFFGDLQMHAWIEVFIPNMGWIGLDPTNKIFADINHVKVAHGRDYSDCPPIKGIVYSSGKNTTAYTVEVSQQQQQQ